MASSYVPRIQNLLAVYALFVIMVFSSEVAAAETYALLVGKNGYPPFVIVDNDSSGTVVYRGVVVDFLDAFEKKHPDYNRQFVSLPRKRANAAMVRGDKIDLMFQSPLFVEQGVGNHYEFTDTLYRSKDVVITRMDDEFIYNEPSDLFDRKVSTILGYRYGSFDALFDAEKILARRVNLHTQAIQLLERNRVDAYFGNIHVSPYFIKQLGLDYSGFRVSEKSLFEFDLSFLVHRKKGNLHTDLNNFIKRSHDDGTLARIMAAYHH